MFEEIITSTPDSTSITFDILVHRPSGAVIRLAGVERSSTIGQLKGRLEEICAIPSNFQTLLLGTVVFDDCEIIFTHASANAPRIHMSLLVSLASATEEVRHPEVQRRLRALQFLCQHGQTNDAQAIMAATAGLEDRNDKAGRLR